LKNKGFCRFGDRCKFEPCCFGRGRGGGGYDRRYDRGYDRGERNYDRPRGDRPVKGAMKPGDWWCINCDVHKYAFRDTCDKCQSTKTEAAEAIVTQKLKELEEKNLPANFRVGHDWMCPGCNKHIFGKHETCDKCNTTKPTDGGVRGMMPEVGAAKVDSSEVPQMEDDGADDDREGDE